MSESSLVPLSPYLLVASDRTAPADTGSFCYVYRSTAAKCRKVQAQRGQVHRCCQAVRRPTSCSPCAKVRDKSKAGHSGKAHFALKKEVRS